MNLADQIFDCLPAGTYALTSLLQVVDIVETMEVPTAAIECRAQPRLLINPQFVARHAHTPERLTALVLHELHHVLLGHTRRFERANPQDNFVFDAVINSIVCRMFPERAYTSLFTGFYSDARFPECLLRPPSHWDPRYGFDLPKALRGSSPGIAAAAAVYRSLYSVGGATYDEIRRVLPKALRESRASLDGVPLLGGHDRNGSEATQASPELADIAGQLIAQWPAPPDPIRGQSLESLLDATRVQVTPPATDRERLRRLICRTACSGVVRVRGGKVGWHDVSVDSPVPVASRRGTVLRALGQAPLLHPHTLQQRRPRSGIEPVHIYLDVSGSVGSIKGALYGAVRDCEELVHREVHLFSTEVHSIGWKALLAGECRTTGGTSISCVERHIAANRVRHAVLITDGWVGRPSPALQAVRLGVAYTRSHSSAELGPVSAASTVLDI